MSSLIRACAVLLLASGLAGCFISEGPLISDEQAAAPYEEITFQAEGESDGTVGVREGNAYMLRDQETEIIERESVAGIGTSA